MLPTLFEGALVLFRACSVLALTGVLVAFAPAAALAGDAEVVPSVSAEQVEVAVGQPTRAPLRFGAVAFSDLPERAIVAFRAAGEDRVWGEWNVEETEGGVTEGEWVGDALWLEVRLDGAETVTAHLIDSTGLSHGPWQRALDALRGAWSGVTAGAVAEAAVAPPLDRPPVVSRAAWGAPTRAAGPRGVRYMRSISAAVVHHTAMSSDYSPAEAPGVVRAVHHIHANLRGWGDVGYNVLVDKYGVVYEGRAGGLERAVIGAHAGGFNRGTFGISVLGTYDTQRPPPEALESVAQMIAWKFRLHGVDPGGQAWQRSTGSTLYPDDHPVLLPTIFAHRNVSNTVCPGRAFYEALPEVRQRVLELTGEYFDIASSAHAVGIETLVDMGVMGGCGPRAFCPNGAVNRGQFATMLARALHLSDPGGQDAFADIATSAHRASVNALVAAEIVLPGERFAPGEPLRRAQLATMVVRAFDAVAPLDLQGRRLFTDISGHPHASAIDGLAAMGMMGGCSGTEFCPNAPVTRGQAATVLTRVLGITEAKPVIEV